MATEEEIADSQTRHQTFSDRQTAGLVNNYVPILEAAEVPLIRGDEDLEGILGIYPINDADEAEGLSMAAKDGYIAELTAFYSTWYSKYITPGVFRPLRSDISAKAINESSFVTRNNSRFVTTTLNTADDALVNELVFDQRYMGEFYRNYVSKYKNLLLNNLRDLTTQRIIQGAPVGAIVNELQGSPASPFNYKHNLGRLETHITTAAKHAEVQADVAFMASNTQAVEGWRFFNPLDSKTSEICSNTFSIDSNNGEKVWPIDGGPKPPLHFNCRSQMIASFFDGVIQ